ncbi:MAG: hypothetical protein AB1486_02365 [Planctomycetota bacterium]
MSRKRLVTASSVLIVPMLACANGAGSGGEAQVSVPEAKSIPQEESMVAVPVGPPHEAQEGATVEGELVYGRRMEVPRVWLEGRLLSVSVELSLPSPAWTFSGFRVEQVEGVPPRIVVSPFAKPPPPDVMAAQVIVNLQKSAVLGTPPVGTYDVVLKTRGEEEARAARLEILPARVLAYLHVQGGIAGLDRHTILTEDGTATFWSQRTPEKRTVRLPSDRVPAFRSLIAELPKEPRSKLTPKGADLRVYDVAWRVKQDLLYVNVDDGTADGAVRSLIGALAELWQLVSR